LPAKIHFRDAAGPDGMRIYAIGDIHGRLDLLTQMHDLIALELERDGPPDWRVIHLGDYVDRGPESRGVVDLLANRLKQDSRVLALAGNHDLGFLDFLGAPDPNGIFARNGGRETARSYGVDLDFFSRSSLRTGHAALAQSVPHDHLAFLRSLGMSAALGDFFFCHAGIRPGISLAEQSPDDLVWIRDRFLNFRGLHEKVIVHGHTPARQPEILPNRVNVDTGAFQTGVLSALVISGAAKRLIHASL
jgi:serine/threonine protein phosphatase 1